MDSNLKDFKQSFDNTVDSVNGCLFVLNELLSRVNGERQIHDLRKIIDVLGKWPEASPALVLRELEDIKRTCCVGADGANVSGTSESLVGMDEMAKILGVKKNWIYQRTGIEGFPVVKVGKYNKFYPSKVIAYVQDKKGNK